MLMNGQGSSLSDPKNFIDTIMKKAERIKGENIKPYTRF